MENKIGNNNKNYIKKSNEKEQVTNENTGSRKVKKDILSSRPRGIKKSIKEYKVIDTNKDTFNPLLFLYKINLLHEVRVFLTKLESNNRADVTTTGLINKNIPKGRFFKEREAAIDRLGHLNFLRLSLDRDTYAQLFISKKASSCMDHSLFCVSPEVDNTLSKACEYLDELKKHCSNIERMFKQKIYTLKKINYTTKLPQGPQKFKEYLGDPSKFKTLDYLTIVDQTGSPKNPSNLHEDRRLDTLNRLKVKNQSIKIFRATKSLAHISTLEALNRLIVSFDSNSTLFKDIRSCPIMAYAVCENILFHWMFFVEQSDQLKSQEPFLANMLSALKEQVALGFAKTLAKFYPLALDVAKELGLNFKNTIYPEFIKDNKEILDAIKNKRKKNNKKLRKRRVIKVEKAIIPQKNPGCIEKTSERGKQEVFKASKSKKISARKVIVNKTSKQQNKIKKMLKQSVKRQEVGETYKAEKKKKEKAELDKRISNIKNSYEVLNAQSFSLLHEKMTKNSKKLLNIVFGLENNDKVINHKQVIKLAKELNQHLSTEGLTKCGNDLLKEVKGRIHVSHDSDSGDKLPKNYIDILRSAFILFGVIPANWEPHTSGDFDAMGKLNNRHFYWNLINS